MHIHILWLSLLQYIFKPIEIQIIPQRGHRKWERQQHMLHTLCVMVNLSSAYIWPQQKWLELIVPHERPAVGRVVFVVPSRTLAKGSHCWQMRRLTWEHSGGKSLRTFGDTIVNMLEDQQKAELDEFILSWRVMGNGHGLPVWSTKAFAVRL